MSLAHIGKPIPEENLIKRAVTRQARPKPSKWETMLYDELLEQGLDAVLWYAFGRYTLDMAIPAHKIAIEIGNECHQCTLVKERDQLKKKLLEEVGWSVMYIAIPHIRYNVLDAAKVVAHAVSQNITLLPVTPHAETILLQSL
jgi:very-short-patch-repair endonuclease